MGYNVPSECLQLVLSEKKTEKGWGIMKGKDRRACILRLLAESSNALSGARLAEQMKVSRQVIVQDIALLRANGADIVSTNLGYLLMKKEEASRVFKVLHSDEEVEEELSLIVDYGGIVKDVFVFHKVYGTVRGDMNIRSRRDVKKFVEDIASGKSSLLKNVTSGYHYHTVLAENEQILDMIQEKLQERGFLARLQDYEPIDFWNREEKGGEA